MVLSDGNIIKDNSMLQQKWDSGDKMKLYKQCQPEPEEVYYGKLDL